MNVCSFERINLNLKAQAQNIVKDLSVYDIKKHDNITQEITNGITQAAKKGKTSYNIYIYKPLIQSSLEFTTGTTVFLSKDSRFTTEEVFKSLYTWLCSVGFGDEDITKEDKFDSYKELRIVQVSWELKNNENE